jgi:hypothetical protein
MAQDPGNSSGFPTAGGAGRRSGYWRRNGARQLRLIEMIAEGPDYALRPNRGRPASSFIEKPVPGAVRLVTASFNNAEPVPYDCRPLA